MRRSVLWLAGSVVLLSGGLAAHSGLAKQQEQEPERPRVIQPGDAARAPSDAVVLFDGSSLDAFRKRDGSAPHWLLEDGLMIVQRGGPLISKEHFGDAQIHVEFRTPAEVKGDGQGRGNSGVYLQGRYEVQVLDSFENDTYPNGQCGAIYGQHPPLVNACRGPGEWQSYDIIFRAARFDDAGKKIENARMTVLHNGVLIQNDAEVTKSTTAAMQGEGPSDGPLYLQDHGNPLAYRNVWLRRL